VRQTAPPTCKFRPLLAHMQLVDDGLVLRGCFEVGIIPGEGGGVKRVAPGGVVVRAQGIGVPVAKQYTT
jgi:hypothetical protein